jgi:hypothetical protein
MSDAPERILAWTYANETASAWNVDPEESAPNAVSYIRADVSVARIADLTRQLAEARASYKEGWRFAFTQWERTGSVPDPDWKPILSALKDPTP